MQEPDKFLLPQHERLLNLATWAKYLAWVVLIVFLGWSVMTYFQREVIFFSTGGGDLRLVDFFKEFPVYALSLIVEMLSIFLKGVVYFLVLRGIALGLNMIVETEINYREQRRAKNEQ